MRRGLVHVLAWLLATGAAVTLSWWGVHTVMRGTVYDAPRALPITAADAAEASASASPTPREPEDPTASASSTKRPSPPSRPPARPSGTQDARVPAPSTAAGPATAPHPSPADSDRIRSYDTEGGHVVFDLGPSSASLVSAAPGPGWSMQVWKTESWIRVEFASGAERVSAFCTWHDGPPRVEIGSY